MEIIKNAISWGNSSGVLLPKEWEGKEVKVILIDRSLEIKKDIFRILETYLQKILGIYLVGSYARGEQTRESDVDVLVITNNLNNRIKRGKYDLILISESEFKREIERNILPLLPMIKEAQPLVNADLIEKYKKIKLTKKNLKFHIETTKSAMKVNKAAIELYKERMLVSDSTTYSLILRLREIYIVNCLIKNKKWGNKEFIKLIKKISGSTKAYERYLDAKNKDTLEYKLPIKEAEKLYNYILEKVREQEKWVKRIK